MEVDCYKPIFLARGATEAEVKQAYKKMSLLHHPMRTRIERPVAPSLRAHEQMLRDQRRQMDSFQMFYIVREAFDVLGDPMRREIFDLYGERDRKEGLQGPDGFAPPNAYHGDKHKTFRDFLGTDNPIVHLLADACVPVNYLAGNNVDPSNVKAPSIYRDLWLDLEEFYTGCVKKGMICKKVLKGQGKKTEFEEKVVSIPVKPETANGPKISFSNEGDESVYKKARDITRERKQPSFNLEGKRINWILFGILIILLLATNTKAYKAVRSLSKEIFEDETVENFVMLEYFIICEKASDRTHARKLYTELIDSFATMTNTDQTSTLKIPPLYHSHVSWAILRLISECCYLYKGRCSATEENEVYRTSIITFSEEIFDEEYSPFKKQN